MSPIEQMLAKVEWKPVPQPEGPDDVPYVTHTGWLEFEGLKIECYHLSNGKRIIPEKALIQFIDLLKAD